MLSVIIPCQEDGFLLIPTLKSIFSNDFPANSFEVLLVRSNNVSISEKAGRFPISEYSDSFKSPAQAINFGVEKAKGTVICVTKPGCIVTTNWLREISKYIHQGSLVDGVGGPIFPCLQFGTRIQLLASEIFHEEHQFPNTISTPTIGQYRASFHSTNMAFRKEVLDSTKFDELFRYNFDFDACWKMLQRGYHLVYNPEMRVEYIFPFSVRNLLSRYFVWGKENIILQKRYSPHAELKAYLYAPYNTFRSLFQPAPFISRKKFLRFVQHLAFNLGRLSDGRAE